MSSAKCNQQLIGYITEKFAINELSENCSKQLKNIVKTFVAKLFIKWRNSHYTYERFRNNNMKWLDEDLKLPEIFELEPLRLSGRPKKDFEESSLRTKQRQISELTSSISTDKLYMATESSLVKSGKRGVAKVVKLAIQSSPNRIKKMKTAHDTQSSGSIRAYSPEEALGLVVDLGLTKEDYITMRVGAKERGADIYPSYHLIVEAKKMCYPPNITVSEKEAFVPLQDLLTHTAERLTQVQAEVILQNISENSNIIEIYYKWGLDGSGGHSIYKQNFADNSLYADSNIILCTIVPLQMCQSNNNKKQIFWNNLTPSSTRYCRPIALKIKKENIQNVKDEYKEVEKQILQLEPTIIRMDAKEIKIKHVLICTMLDGKTINILTENTNSQACNICKASAKDLNDLGKLQNRDCDESAFKFGISVLHAHIRCYEYLLHIAYKLEIKQWQARGENAKANVKERKTKIATEFYNKLGLVVDQPKQGGGNSNDGNTARKFFENPSLSSEITGVDKELIIRFSNILSVISCGHYIKEDIFKIYCVETAHLAISLYGWYKMSATVHKLLLHGADIIKSLPLPIGQLSEDVIEAGHKEYKILRQCHSRKTSRINTNVDIFNWMLVSSDPIVTSKRKNPKKNKTKFNQVVISMLRTPICCANEDEEAEL